METHLEVDLDMLFPHLVDLTTRRWDPLPLKSIFLKEDTHAYAQAMFFFLIWLFKFLKIVGTHKTKNK